MTNIYARKGLWLLPLFILIFFGTLGLYFSADVSGNSALIVWQHFKSIAFAAALFFIAYSIGMKLLRLTGVYEHDRLPIYVRKEDGKWVPEQSVDPELTRHLQYELISLEKATFATGLGLGSLSLATLALAIVQLLTPLWVILLLASAALTVPGEMKWLYRYFQIPGDWRQRGTRKSREIGALSRGILLTLILVSLLFGAISALAPPHQSDALRYHLAAPEEYVRSGGWVYLRNSAFSNFPFNIEMLYSICLVFDQDVSCRLVHLGFFALTLMALYSAGRRFHNRTAGLLAAAVFSTTPFAPILASWAFIEMGMTFYTFATLYALALWLNRQFARGRKRGWLGAYQLPLRSSNTALLAGALCGLALGVKYTALFLAAFSTALILGVCLYRLENRKKISGDEIEKSTASPSTPLKDLLWFLFAASVIASPWYIKNFIVTGNPFFPFLNSIFESPHWSRFEAAFYSFHAAQKGGLLQFKQMGLLGKLWDLIELPLRATIYPLGGWRVGPLYLVYTFLLILMARRLNRGIRLSLWAALFFFFVWGVTYRDNRFLLPVLALLAISFGVVFGSFWRKPDRVRSLMIFGLVALMIFGQISMLFNLMNDQNPFPVVSGRMSRWEFLEKELDYLHTFRFLNSSQLPPGKVLMVGEHRTYYCQRETIASDWFNEPVLIRYIKESGNIPALVERLKEKGIEYILVNEQEIEKYRFYYLFHFLPEEEALRWLEIMKQGLFSQRRTADQFVAQVISTRSFALYESFLQSQRYLKQVYPDEEDAKIRIYQLNY